MTPVSPPQGAQAALRAIRLLKLFTNERPEMTLGELSKAAGLNKTTTHRLLRALVSEALVQKNPATGRYSLGTGLMALGVQALSSSDLRRRVRPVLRGLAQVTGPHVVGAAGNVGTRWPLHATSTGKIFLAFDEDRLERLREPLPALTPKTLVDRSAFESQLIEVRRRGYAETVDELEDGFTAVATVLRGALGDLQGALSIGGPTRRLGTARRAELGATLRRAAERINPDF
jgi:DNA-binding IclR family transcriptional regulator